MVRILNFYGIFTVIRVDRFDVRSKTSSAQQFSCTLEILNIYGVFSQHNHDLEQVQLVSKPGHAHNGLHLRIVLFAFSNVYNAVFQICVVHEQNFCKLLLFLVTVNFPQFSVDLGYGSSRKNMKDI